MRPHTHSYTWVLLDHVFISVTNHDISRHLLSSHLLQAQLWPSLIPRAHTEEVKVHQGLLKTSNLFSHSCFQTAISEPFRLCSFVTQSLNQLISTPRQQLCLELFPMPFLFSRTKISTRTSLPSRGHVEMSGEGFFITSTWKGTVPCCFRMSMMGAHSAA